MQQSSEKGFLDEGILILIALCVIIFLFVLPGKSIGPNRNAQDFIAGESSSAQNSNQGQSNGSKERAKRSSIYIGTGNASHVFQPNSEYITIENRGSDPINITGWKLRNGKDKRYTSQGSRDIYINPDIISIPAGALILAPKGDNSLQNIILNPNDRAIITTGGIPTKTPYRIVSFKENMCSGYLGSLDRYTFTPTLTRSCPDPSAEPGVSNLDLQCQQFIKRMNRCETPEFGKDREGESCRTCVNGTKLSNTCSAFIKSHFSYEGCLINHSGKPNFQSNTWRVFLGHRNELWGERYEMIQLFDNFDTLITSTSY